MKNILIFLYITVVNLFYKFWIVIFKNEENEKPKLKRTPSIENLVLDEYSDIDEKIINDSPRSMKKCRFCNIKLYQNEILYFAFDKKLCFNCWTQINSE